MHVLRQKRLRQGESCGLRLDDNISFLLVVLLSLMLMWIQITRLTAAVVVMLLLCPSKASSTLLVLKLAVCLSVAYRTGHKMERPLRYKHEYQTLLTSSRKHQHRKTVPKGALPSATTHMHSRAQSRTHAHAHTRIRSVHIRTSSVCSQLPPTASLRAEAPHWACDASNRTATIANPGSKSPYKM